MEHQRTYSIEKNNNPLMPVGRWSLHREVCCAGAAINGMLPDALIQYLRSPLPRHDRIPEEHVLEAVIE